MGYLKFRLKSDFYIKNKLLIYTHFIFIFEILMVVALLKTFWLKS